MLVRNRQKPSGARGAEVDVGGSGFEREIGDAPGVEAVRVESFLELEVFARRDLIVELHVVAPFDLSVDAVAERQAQLGLPEPLDSRLAGIRGIGVMVAGEEDRRRACWAVWTAARGAAGKGRQRTQARILKKIPAARH